MWICARRRSGKYPVKRKEHESGLYGANSTMMGGPEAAEDEHKKFLEYQYGYSSTKQPQML